MRFWLAPIVVCLVAVAASAQDDPPGSKDHPMFSRMPSYVIVDANVQDFGADDFNVGHDTTKHVEGQYSRIQYAVKEGGRKAGPLQIGRNYTDLLVKRGGKRLTEELSAGGGETTASMPVAGGRTLWLRVGVNNDGEQYELVVVEEAAMKQEVAFSAGELADALNATGSIALHNVLFDTGTATLKAESAGALAPVGELLKNDASLNLEIQGHTDNVGQAPANLRLSQDRAAAVKAHLVQNFGIPAARLTTAGFGDTKPLAPNTSDDGRAQNRRVELVKK
jgi:OOP family OmpA-OmpF porin